MDWKDSREDSDPIYRRGKNAWLATEEQIMMTEQRLERDERRTNLGARIPDDKRKRMRDQIATWRMSLSRKQQSDK